MLKDVYELYLGSECAVHVGAIAEAVVPCCCICAMYRLQNMHVGIRVSAESYVLLFEFEIVSGRIWGFM